MLNGVSWCFVADVTLYFGLIDGRKKAVLGIDRVMAAN
jgi:hypothetical protein